MSESLELKQRLRAATSRAAADLDEETQQLQQAYASLGQLLESQESEVDEAALVSAVLDGPPRWTLPVHQDAAQSRYPTDRDRLFLVAIAASFLLLIALAGQQFVSVPAPDVPAAGGSEQHPATAAENADPQLAWEDDWDLRLELALDDALAVLDDGYLRLESASWSVHEALRELEF